MIVLIHNSIKRVAINLDEVQHVEYGEPAETITVTYRSSDQFSLKGPDALKVYETMIDKWTKEAKTEDS